MQKTTSSDILDMDVLNQLKKLFGDNFGSGVDQFLANALKNIVNIEESIESHDMETLERSSHSLKGASGQFGAIQMSNLAAEMEVYGREGDLDSAKQNVACLRTAHEQIAELMTMV